MSSNTSPAPLAVSIEDACRILGIGNTKIYEEINAGRLKAKKVGAKTLLPTKQFPGWLKSLPPRRLRSPPPRKSGATGAP